MVCHDEPMKCSCNTVNLRTKELKLKGRKERRVKVVTGGRISADEHDYITEHSPLAPACAIAILKLTDLSAALE